MTLQNTKEPINTVQPQNQNYVSQLINLNKTSSERLSNDQRGQISERTTQKARSDVAKRLINSRSAIAGKHQPESNGQIAARIIVTGIGSVMYVTAASIFAGSLGKLTLPASLVGGGILSFIVDRCATKAITNKGIEDNTKATIKSLETEAKSLDLQDSPFLQKYYQEQRRFVVEIEGENLPYKGKIPTNTIAAASLNTLEFSTACWLLSGATVFGGSIPIVVLPILSSLPVLFTWGFALYQREAFELPEHYADLMPSYNKYVFVQTSNQDLINQEYQDVLLNAEVSNVIDQSNPYPTPQSAKSQANSQYCNFIIGQLQRNRDDRLSAIKQQLQNDLNNVNSQYKPLAGLNYSQQEQAKADWNTKEADRLQKTAHSEIEFIQNTFNAEINVWQRRIDEIPNDKNS